MSEEIKPEKIKKTQESLNKFIKKPPLTDKLLKKPPFRFLHDIVTSVMRETGFLNGVFTPEELNSENIKDRESKINFLEKLIAYIKEVTGSSISAKPSKIIAGLEVNKTLDLLLVLAKGADVKVNGSKVNDKTSSLKNETKDLKKTIKISKDDKTNTTKKKRDDSKTREKDSKKKTETKPTKTEKKKNEVIDKKEKTVKEKAPDNNLKKPEPNNKPEPETPKEEKPESDLPPVTNGTNEQIATENSNTLDEEPLPQKERPPSARIKSSAVEPNSSSEKRVRSSIKRQNSGSTPLPEMKSELSNGSEKPPSEEAVAEQQSSLENRPRLPSKISLEHTVQMSSDSVTNSNISSDPSDKIFNGTTSSETNGELSSLEGVQKPEKKSRVSSVSSAHDRASSRNEIKNDFNKKLEKVEENVKTEEPAEKSVKIKRPQSAKLRPGSIRQRRAADESLQDEKSGQVVLGQGESTDVMGSAPITAPSAKGRRMLSGRPMSSRPGAPKPKDRGQVTIPEAPNPSEEVKTIALIEDKVAAEEEDTENLVVVEERSSKNEDEMNNKLETDLNLDESNQGALVAQILETKKELEDTKKGHWDSRYHQKHNVEIDWDARSRNRRDVLAKEVHNLREGIQTVTRSSNPLGKLFDFLQEDVELMQTELQEWNNTNAQLKKDIQLQHKKTEELLTPLHKQLSDIDLLIEHEQESIRRVKSTIYLNSTKLDNLLKLNNT